MILEYRYIHTVQDSLVCLALIPETMSDLKRLADAYVIHNSKGWASGYLAMEGFSHIHQKSWKICLTNLKSLPSPFQHIESWSIFLRARSKQFSLDSIEMGLADAWGPSMVHRKLQINRLPLSTTNCLIT